MKSFRLLQIILFLSFIGSVSSQTKEISGVVKAEGSVEGIHVINKSSYRYATTDSNGEFTIVAKTSDSLYFSSIQYTPKFVVVNSTMMNQRYVEVYLDDNITALDEVAIGQILTGDLNSDITNSDAERPLDFYDLGIPGYTGPRKTQNESRLFEADAGKMLYVGFPYAMFNLNKFLNTITGRTKKLKYTLKIEKDKSILTHIKEVVGPELFKNESLDDGLRTEFYHFCADDPEFQLRCTNRSDVEIMQYLDQKLTEFKSNNLNQN